MKKIEESWLLNLKDLENYIIENGCLPKENELKSSNGDDLLLWLRRKRLENRNGELPEEEFALLNDFIPFGIHDQCIGEYLFNKLGVGDLQKGLGHLTLSRKEVLGLYKAGIRKDKEVFKLIINGLKQGKFPENLLPIRYSLDNNNTMLNVLCFLFKDYITEKWYVELYVSVFNVDVGELLINLFSKDTTKSKRASKVLMDICNLAKDNVDKWVSPLKKNEFDYLTQRYYYHNSITYIADKVNLSTARVSQVLQTIKVKLRCECNSRYVRFVKYGDMYIRKSELDALKLKSDKFLSDIQSIGASSGLEDTEDEVGTSITALGFSVRVHNALLRSNIKTLADLKNLTVRQLYGVRGLGEKGRQEIKDKVKDFGIVLE